MNVFSRIGNVFVAPSKCFVSIQDQGKKWTDYVIPFILLVAMVVVFMAMTSELMQQASVDAIMKMDQLSDAQKQAAIQQQNSPIVNIIKYASSVVVTAVSVLIGALIMWIVGNFIGGGDQKYGTLLVTALYIQLISIPESIIKLILMLQKDVTTVYVGFASLVSEPNLSSFGFQALGQLEFFKIWRIIVWVIAFKVLYKFTGKKSTLLVVITMILGMLLQALWTSFQMGRMG